MSAPVFYSEARLADAAGVSRSDMKFMRDTLLEVDRDWKKIRGEVALNTGGVKRIWSELVEKRNPPGFDLACCVIDLDLPVKKNGANASNGATEPPAEEPNSLPVPVAMTVIKIPLNPCVVLATDPARTVCTVWVGRSANFVVGDKIDAVPHDTQPGFWRFVGQIPRQRRRI